MKFGFYVSAVFALVAFCGGWGGSAVICALLFAAMFWQLDRETW